MQAHAREYRLWGGIKHAPPGLEVMAIRPWNMSEEPRSDRAAQDAVREDLRGILVVTTECS